MFDELRQNNAILENLNDLASDWRWEQDADFRFTYFSPGIERIVGKDSTKSIGRTRWDEKTTLSEAEWAAHRACLEAHLPFRDFEYGGWRGEGKLVYLSISGHPVFGKDGSFCGYRGTGKNVTERKRWEQELMSSEARFESLFELSPVALSVNFAQAMKRALPLRGDRLSSHSEPWSVIATAFMPISPAASITRLIWHAPSRRLYSVWKCRWTNGMFFVAITTSYSCSYSRRGRIRLRVRLR